MARFLANSPNSGFPSFTVLEANALTDLAATGRGAYNSLKNHWNSSGRENIKNLVLSSLTPLLSSHPSFNHTALISVINSTLDRVAMVAWFLAGNSNQRAAFPISFGWLCVSADDDPPHSPINVPSNPYIQYRLNVPTTGNSRQIDIETRCFIAPSVKRSGLYETYIPKEFTLPRAIDICQAIPVQDEIIIYIHGHSSKAEEALDVIPEIWNFAKERGKNYTIISLDLPCCGYSSMINHNDIAPLDATHYPAGYPMLQFIEDFIVKFINKLDEKVKIKHRIACVMGGSLGGNMALRLAERPYSSYLKKIVAYSPASLWPTFAKEGWPKNQAISRTKQRIVDDDTDDLRFSWYPRDEFFRLTFDDPEFSVIWAVVQAQPYYWYRDDWQPCKDQHTYGSKIERREIYNSKFKNWHWRVALEQLLFSHVENDTPTGIPRYSLINKPLLLGAGELDDHVSGIYTYTLRLANLLVLFGAVNGKSFFLQHTGHSIHNERPKVLAHQVVSFISSTSLYQDVIRVALRFNFKSTYLGTQTATSSTSMAISWSDIDNPSSLTMTFISFNTVKFKNYRNKFLTLNSDETLSFSEANNAQSQIFTIARSSSFGVLFIANNGKCINFLANGFSATGALVGANDFDIINLEECIPFKLIASDGRVLFMVGNNIPNRLRHTFAASEQIFENFFLIFLGNNKYAIKSERGNFLRENESDSSIIAHRSVIGIPETFEFIIQENGNYIIKTPKGNFLTLPSIDYLNRADGFTAFLTTTGLGGATQFYFGCGLQPPEPQQPPIDLSPELISMEKLIRELVKQPKFPPPNPLLDQALIESKIKYSVLEKNLLQNVKGGYYFKEDFYSKLLSALWSNQVLQNKLYKGSIELANKSDRDFADLIMPGLNSDSIYFKLSDEKSIPRFKELANGKQVEFTLYKYPFAGMTTIIPPK